MEYTTHNGWLNTPYGSTKFWSPEDVEWMKEGNKPKTNQEGYMVLPYGHKDGKELYPELHGTEPQPKPELEADEDGWVYTPKYRYGFYWKQYDNGCRVSLFLGYMTHRPHNKGWYGRITTPDGRFARFSEISALKWDNPNWGKGSGCYNLGSLKLMKEFADSEFGNRIFEDGKLKKVEQ